MVCLLVAIIIYANPNSIVGVNEVETVGSGSTFRLRNILCLRSCRHKRFDCIRPVEYPPMIAQAIIIIITTTTVITRHQHHYNPSDYGLAANYHLRY